VPPRQSRGFSKDNNTPLDEPQISARAVLGIGVVLGGAFVVLAGDRVPPGGDKIFEPLKYIRRLILFKGVSVKFVGGNFRDYLVSAKARNDKPPIGESRPTPEIQHFLELLFHVVALASDYAKRAPNTPARKAVSLRAWCALAGSPFPGFPGDFVHVWIGRSQL
jgi:hypothetical protein